MLDEDVNLLRPGERVHVSAIVCEPYTGTGALLVEVTEKNCSQRFWLPTSSLEPAPK